jgi:hypothetical protein
MNSEVVVLSIDWDADRRCSRCACWKRPREFKTYSLCYPCADYEGQPRFIGEKPIRRTPGTRRPRGSRMIDENKTWVTQHKLIMGCLGCDEQDPCCLDLHHEDPSKKDDEIAALVRTAPLHVVKAEAAKCIVICSNCHRKLHRWLRQHSEQWRKVTNTGSAAFRALMDDVYRQCFKRDAAHQRSLAATALVTDPSAPFEVEPLDFLEMVKRLQTIIGDARGKIRASDVMALAGVDQSLPYYDQRRWAREALARQVMNHLGWKRGRYKFDGARKDGYTRGASLARGVVLEAERGDDGQLVIRRQEP